MVWERNDWRRAQGDGRRGGTDGSLLLAYLCLQKQKLASLRSLEPSPFAILDSEA